MKMRTLSLVSAVSLIAGLAASSNALAADFLLPAPESVLTQQDFSWTGFYVGVNGGYGGGVLDHPMDYSGPFGQNNANISVLSGSGDITSGGFIGGAQAGFNYQFDSIVIGLEADIQKSWVEGRVSINGSTAAPLPAIALGIEGGTALDWYATIRPRLGFAHDRFLVYVTGGLAYGSMTSSYDVNLNGTTFADSTTNSTWGWVVGGGVEYAVTDNVSLKTEYTYTDFRPVNLLNTGIGPGTLNIDSDVNVHAVRAGINFRF